MCAALIGQWWEMLLSARDRPAVVRRDVHRPQHARDRQVVHRPAADQPIGHPTASSQCISQHRSSRPDLAASRTSIDLFFSACISIYPHPLSSRSARTTRQNIYCSDRCRQYCSDGRRQCRSLPSHLRPSRQDDRAPCAPLSLATATGSPDRPWPADALKTVRPSSVAGPAPLLAVFGTEAARFAALSARNADLRALNAAPAVRAQGCSYFRDGTSTRARNPAGDEPGAIGPAAGRGHASTNRGPAVVVRMSSACASHVAPWARRLRAPIILLRVRIFW